MPVPAEGRGLTNHGAGCGAAAGEGHWRPEEVAEEEVPWPPEGAGHGEVPT